MPTTISSELAKAFASSPVTHSTGRRYTVTAISEHGTCRHCFVDLDAAILKIHELALLGITELSIRQGCVIEED